MIARRILRFSSMCVLALGLVSASGCSGNPASGFTLSGTLTKAGADGKIAHLKLVAQGGAYTDAALYFTVSGAFGSGTAGYSIDSVEAGDYAGWAFIDMNDNAVAGSGALPDAGDWVTASSAAITISDDTVVNIPEQAWVTF